MQDKEFQFTTAMVDRFIMHAPWPRRWRGRLVVGPRSANQVVSKTSKSLRRQQMIVLESAPTCPLDRFYYYQVVLLPEISTRDRTSRWAVDPISSTWQNPNVPFIVEPNGVDLKQADVAVGPPGTWWCHDCCQKTSRSSQKVRKSWSAPSWNHQDLHLAPGLRAVRKHAVVTLDQTIATAGADTAE